MVALKTGAEPLKANTINLMKLHDAVKPGPATSTVLPNAEFTTSVLPDGYLIFCCSRLRVRLERRFSAEYNRKIYPLHKKSADFNCALE